MCLSLTNRKCPNIPNITVYKYIKKILKLNTFLRNTVYSLKKCICVILLQKCSLFYYLMQFTQLKNVVYFFQIWRNTVDTNLFYSITSNTVFSLHIYQTNLPLESLLVTIFDPMASNKRLTQVSWSLTLQDRGFRERQVERKLKKKCKKDRKQSHSRHTQHNAAGWRGSHQSDENLFVRLGPPHNPRDLWDIHTSYIQFIDK